MRPDTIRGRVLGLFSMSRPWACGRSAASPSASPAGVIGIHWSLSLSAILLLVVLAVLFVVLAPQRANRVLGADGFKPGCVHPLVVLCQLVRFLEAPGSSTRTVSTISRPPSINSNARSRADRGSAVCGTGPHEFYRSIRSYPRPMYRHFHSGRRILRTMTVSAAGNERSQHAAHLAA